jgi:hypothetical protein
MQKRAMAKKRQQRSIVAKRRFFQRVHSNSWQKVKVASVGKIKPGDMILTVSQRHTFGGFFNRAVAKLSDGKFAHVAACTNIAGSKPMINDFKGSYGHRQLSFDQLAKTGVNLKVVRWKNISPNQLDSFIHNLKLIPTIGNKYDFFQSGYYGLRVLYKHATGKEIPQKLLVDIKKRFTCSEYISTAAKPNAKEIFSHGLKQIRPKLEFSKNENRELVTPAIIDAAVDAGILELVTEQTWQHSK